MLTLSSVGIASAKSYEFTLNTPTRVGTTELKPGVYSLRLEGSQAILTSQQNSQSFTFPAKIEHNKKKFDNTEVQLTNKDGVDHIQEIDLGGSDTRLELGQ